MNTKRTLNGTKRFGGTNASTAAPVLRLSPQGRLRRYAAFSALGLLAYGPWPPAAYAAGPTFGSSAWLAQQSALRSNPPASSGSSTSATPNPGASTAIAAMNQSQAKTLATRSMKDLAAAAQAIMQKQQAMASAAAAPPPPGVNVPNVPDGLASGGLKVSSTVNQSAVSANPTAPCTSGSAWCGASLPSQQVSNGQYNVTIAQNQQKAILTWDSFNVGKNTTVDFDQSAGTQTNGSNNWVVLNRVLDTNMLPSYILGSIKAQGSVYLINHNGFLFGGSSVVNTQSLLVSSLDLFSSNTSQSNATFLSGGLDTPGLGATNSKTLLGDGTNLDIRILPGASITSGDNGYVLMAGANVYNGGSITATDGQVVLAAGYGLHLGVSSTSNQWSPSLNSGDDTSSAQHLVDNTGIVESLRGNASLLGFSVVQDGVVGATTSITHPGSILIQAADYPNGPSGLVGYTGSVEFIGKSVTAILPSDDGETTTSSSSATDSFTKGALPQATIEGGSITLGSGSLIEMPGATLNISTLTDPVGRFYMASNSTIDVSGLANVSESVSDTLVTIGPLTANDVADSPLLRDSFLIGQTVVIDSTLSGTNSNGLQWQGSPIISGGSAYIDAVPRNIDELLTNGGTVNLTANQVITRNCSLIDVDGGFIAYQGGMVSGTTRLVGADGRIYDIGAASTDVDYVGIAGQTTVDYSRWGITQTWSDRLLSGYVPHYEPGFIQGGTGGKLNIGVGTAAVLDGNISAQTYIGSHQINGPQNGSKFSVGTLQSNSAAGPNYVINDQDYVLPPDFTATTALPTSGSDSSDTTNIDFWTPINGTKLADAGFAEIDITAQPNPAFSSSGRIVVDPGAGLAVKAGGTIKLTAFDFTMLGTPTAPGSFLTAPGGNIEVTTSGPGGITIGPNATISAAGRWVNDSGKSVDQLGGSVYIDGGTISLLTLESSASANGVVSDTTSSIVLNPGSKLDVSSGGYVQQDGALLTNDGVVQAKGGTIDLWTYALGPTGTSGEDSFNLFGGSAPPGYAATNQTLPLPGSQPTNGQILGLSDSAILLGYGFSDGGTLSVHALGFQIGGDAQAAPFWASYLPTSLFGQNGFSHYSLQALYDIDVAAGTSINLKQQNYLPDIGALQLALTGTPLYGSNLVSIGALDDYHRQAGSLSMIAGEYLTWNGGVNPPSYAGVSGDVVLGQGASIVAPSSAQGQSSISLDSYHTVSVLGQIDAQGGQISLGGQNIALGPDAKLDVSGVALIDPYAAPVQSNGVLTVPVTGTVLKGGDVSLEAAGTVAVQAGATIDVSGAGSVAQPIVFDIAQNGGGYAPQQEWSQAGTITLAAGGGLYFDGTIKVQGGSGIAADGSVGHGEGGALTLTALDSASAVILLPSGDLLPDGWQPGQAVPGAAAGTLYFAADRLDGSGISSLAIDSNSNPASSFATPGAVTIGFAGPVSLNLQTSFSADAIQFLALDPGCMSIGCASSAGDAVNITAPYVSLSGYHNTSVASLSAPQAPSGNATLNIDANFIDLGGAFALGNFAQASFNSTPNASGAGGDIRFYTPEQYDFIGSSPVPQRGLLYGSGALVFNGGELYPGSGNSVAVVSTAAAGTGSGCLASSICIEQAPSTNGSAVPLSAGGSLLIDAPSITQDGTIRAPQGTIVLGVGDTSDAATQALFNPVYTNSSGQSQVNNPLSLVATGTVNLGGNSRTSVALDGAYIPYGTTVDGAEWQYNVSQFGNQTLADLTAPPAKLIEINGAKVGIGNGAQLDISGSGGGELYAVEWVPGTGGSRDVLAQSNISYAQSVAGTAVPQYPDGRGVYAIVPLDQARLVAAYDPVYSDSAAAGVPIGQAIYISGSPGIPAGTYVLMPVKYATLPGAYRVVQDTSAIDTVASQNSSFADGTQWLSGWYVNALDGTRTSRSTAFEIQPQSVWGQYSNYSITNADTFFANLATTNGTAAAQLPRDAGQIILDAGTGLQFDGTTLGQTVNANAGSGGAAGQIDITSQAIQIVSTADPQAAAGVLQLTASDLSGFGGSLLIGGVRSQSSAGTVITAQADSVELSNDADHPLQGAEIILAAKGGSGPGVQVDNGASIQASGTLSGSTGKPIVIGDSATGVAGDGALLLISTGPAESLTRQNLSASGGHLSVGANAQVGGDQTGFLLLDSSADTLVDPSAQLAAKNITADAGAITFVADASQDSAAGGMIIGLQTLALFSQASQVNLRSYGSIDFEGKVDVTVGQALGLSAGSFTDGAYGNAGAVSLNAATLVLGNALDAPATALHSSATTGTLALNANEIDFGSAGGGATTAAFSGFASVQAVASGKATGGGGIVGYSNVFDFGNAPVTLTGPVILAGSNANATIQTSGTLTLATNGGTALPAADLLGGELKLVGGGIENNALIQAASGNVTLEAASGDVHLGSGASINVAGQSKLFNDVYEYAPGGSITLSADAGNVRIDSGASLNYSGAGAPDGSAAGSNAGSLSIGAANGTATIAGTLTGAAGCTAAACGSGGAGGSFSLDVGGTADLNSLAGVLSGSGIDQAVSVRSGQGDLSLDSATLKAGSVSLLADGGAVNIGGLVDASGAAGGSIELYGKSGVDLEGKLDAHASAAGQSGGAVAIGTAGTVEKDPTTNQVSLNTQYGYENMDPATSGVITLGSKAVIDVSGAQGGTVSFRAPLLSNGDVNLNIASGASITGASSVTLEAYAVWSTSDPVIDPAKHFDGYIDPAGWYDSSGQLVSGTFYNQDGIAVASGSNLCPDPANCSYLANDYFMPDTGKANAAHQTFYGYVNGDSTQGAGTLMGFVQNPGFSQAFQDRVAGIAAHIDHFQVAPGIELDNPVSGGVNNGTIELLSNWNLGAGTVNRDGSYSYAYRYQGVAPVLTVRAGNNLEVDASLSDGFAQLGAGPDLTYVAAAYTQAYNGFKTTTISAGAGITIRLSSSAGCGTACGAYPIGNDSDYVAFAAPPSDQVPGSNNQSGNYYLAYTSYNNSIRTWSSGINLLNGRYTILPSTKGRAPQLSQFTSYADYYTAYASWLTSTYHTQAGTTSTPPPPQVPGDLADYSSSNAQAKTYLSLYTNVYYQLVKGTLDLTSGHVFVYIFPPLPPPQSSVTLSAGIDSGNAPANVASLQNVAPLAYATLAGGNSSSYNLVAGADLASADPLAVQPASSFAAGSATAAGGNLTIGGHTAVADEIEAFQSAPRSLAFPTELRTGSGSISIATGGDFELTDSTAPGVVYTAGVPAAGTTADSSLSILRSDTAAALTTTGELIVNGVVHPQGAGDISIQAQGDIVGLEQVYDSDGSRTGSAGAYVGQFWWPWMQTGNGTGGTQSSINYSAFDQGILSAGGNVSISAGGDIRDLSVSLPTTWTISQSAGGSGMVNTIGGGKLSVNAGGDILSGSYFVARGQGSINASGAIGSDFTWLSADGLSTPVATLLALQHAQLNVQARQGIELGGAYDPSYLQPGFDSQSYSADSSLSVHSSAGDLVYGTINQPANLFGFIVDSRSNVQANTASTFILPASLDMVALEGGIAIETPGELYPSADGQLNLVANGNVQIYDGLAVRNGTLPLGYFGLIDTPPELMPSPQDPYQGDNAALQTWLCVGSNAVCSFTAHPQTPLHGGAEEFDRPARIYSLNDSLIDGTVGADGYYQRGLQVVADKPALIYAGQDIVNLNFLGQNLRDSDLTRIVAGGSIYDTPLGAYATGTAATVYPIPSLLLSGPGSFDVEAGKGIGPLTHQGEATSQGSMFASNTVLTGIEAVGNLYDPYLAPQSASINVLFGVAPGIDVKDFVARYIAPGASVNGIPSFTPELIAFMEAYDAGQAVDTGYVAQQQTVTLDAAQAWPQFQLLPPYRQQQFVEQVYFQILKLVATNYNDSGSPYFHQYARGYDAINTLFPAAYGYTANHLEGGTNGANQTVHTGDLDLRGSTIQTQQGGSINLLGPGGQALLGSASAPPYIVDAQGNILAGPNTIGILTLEQGDINVFTDESVLLAQSRVFTEQGGDILLWSANGDINAGSGRKSSAFVPPLDYICNLDHYCIVNVMGEVSGAGIATLQTVPDAAPGSVYLVAPRGTVDAGAAGIRVSGNLVVAAQHVANAFNIDVKGSVVGVPQLAKVDSSALAAASNAVNAAVQTAAQAGRQAPDTSQAEAEVVGFGTPDEEQKKKLRRKEVKAPQ